MPYTIAGNEPHLPIFSSNKSSYAFYFALAGRLPIANTSPIQTLQFQLAGAIDLSGIPRLVGSLARPIGVSNLPTSWYPLPRHTAAGLVIEPRQECRTRAAGF